MKARKCSILPETTLERYLTEMMPAQIAGAIYDVSIESVENHLLICPNCQLYAETHELLMRALRADQAGTRGHVIAVGMVSQF